LPATSEREGYYLDGTADRNPVGYLRADDQGARVLHVSERGGELHDIPYATPDENALRRTYRVALNDDGSGEVELSDRSDGMYAVMLRYRYGGGTGGQESQLAQELDAGFGSVTVESIATSDLEDITEPATLDARFAAKNLWTSEGRLRSLRVGFDDLGISSLAAEPPVDRLYDVVLDRPYAQETDVTWTLPPGASLQSTPPEIHVSAEGLLDYRQTVEPVDGGVRVRRRFSLETRRVPLERYADFRDALHQVEQAERRTVRVVPGAGAEGSL
ncbi:MAG: hypothetical protein H6825_13680, partial [Planctomycetes bacterium]|nr:hypothetical protein [Planctomycetota bacterium]